MVVYDITNSKSFNECKNYCKQAILENCKKDIKVMLLGIKQIWKIGEKFLKKKD